MGARHCPILYVVCELHVQKGTLAEVLQYGGSKTRDDHAERVLRHWMGGTKGSARPSIIWVQLRPTREATSVGSTLARCKLELTGARSARAQVSIAHNASVVRAMCGSSRVRYIRYIRCCSAGAPARAPLAPQEACRRAMTMTPPTTRRSLPISRGPGRAVAARHDRVSSGSSFCLVSFSAFFS